MARPILIGGLDMAENPVIEILRQNRLMRSKSEVSAFDDALASIAQSLKDEDLPALYSVFTDECQHHEAMYGLVHLLESFDMKRQLASFIEAVPAMSVQAPEWTKVLHCRILNDEASRDWFRRLYHSARPAAKDAVKAVLLEIQADDTEFTSRVRQLVA
jgi:hypothetical protein